MLEKGDRVKDKRSGKTGVLTGGVFKHKMKGLQHEVYFDDGTMVNVSDTVLEKIPRAVSPLEKFSEGIGFLDYTEYRQYMTFLRMKGDFTNIYYSMRQGNIQFLPYQMKPVIKFISSFDKRLLIADEVGLGKTVETLLIWKELEARDEADRLLVVVPAMLKEKWENDMKNFFGINAEIVDARELYEKLKSEDENRGNGFALITSIQGIRSKGFKSDKKPTGADILNNYLERFSENHPDKKLIDLLVFDEAHYLVNKSTANNKTAAKLNEVSEGMILLSATPINGNTDEFYNLLKLLSPDQFIDKKEFDRVYVKNKKLVKLAHLFHSIPGRNEVKNRKDEIRGLLKEIRDDAYYSRDTFFSKIEKELDFVFGGSDDGHYRRMKIYDEIVQKYFYSDVVTRSKKKDVLKCAIRTPQIVSFKLSDKEKAVYDKATKELKAKLEENDDLFWAFCVLSRQRELSSCIPAAIARWKEQGNIILDSEFDEEEKEEIELEFDEDKKRKDVVLTFPNLADVDIASLEKIDSKFEHFLKALKEKLLEGEKIIVFSFFRGTLKYLARRLKENGVRTAMILGGMKPSDKERELEAFKDKESNINVLLSSEVGAEGLDLQFSRIEFNYDLPWNPMRLEQRIGRIDRIGQESEKIFIINLSCSNTVEDKVLDTLYKKIKVCEETIGEIDEVLGEKTNKIQLELLKSEKSDEEKLYEQDKEITRLANELVNKETLEENIGLTKKYNDRLIDYVNSADTNHRFLKDEDYEYYITDFLANHGHGSSFEKASSGGWWELSLSSEDKNLYRDFLSRENINAHIPKGEYIRCSLPSCKDKSATWKIDVSHPFVKWINSIIEEHHKIADCYIFHVDGSRFDQGKNFKDRAYVFCISNFEFKYGLKKTNELISEAVSVDSSEALSRDDADYLLSTAIYYGTPSDAKTLDFDSVGEKRIDAMQLCLKRYQDDEFELEQELEEKNTVSCEQRIQRINDVYGQREQRLTAILDEAVAQGKKTISMTEGQIRKNSQKWEEALDEIEKKRNPIPYTEMKALGIIFID